MEQETIFETSNSTESTTMFVSNTGISTTISENENVCDESKCVSRGRSNLHDNSFTCFGDDQTIFPMMCADGYLPKVVETEPESIAADVDGIWDIPVQYFTCCPPESSQATRRPTRHCSDPITAPTNHGLYDNESNWGLCKDQKRKHSRYMKLTSENTEDEFLMCCDSKGSDQYDSEEESSATVFLESTECVPYRNEFYAPARAQNKIGEISVVWCDFPDGDFRVPRPYGTTIDFESTGRYQCCKDGDALPPFVQDSAFKTTLYPTIALCSIAAVSSLAVIVALLIPLMIQLKDGSFQRAEQKLVRRNSKGGSSQASSTQESSSHGGHSGTRRRRKPNGQRAPRIYSTYNMYLVYLAIPQLIFALYRIGTNGSMMNQKFNPNFYSSVVLPPTLDAAPNLLENEIGNTYAVVNLWLNAMIFYEVLNLLRTSRRGRRLTQPNLRRVNLQAAGVYLITAISFSILYGLGYEQWKCENDGDTEKGQTLSTVKLAFTSVMSLLPFGYILYVLVVVKCRKYIPSMDGISTKGKTMRKLFFYFVRILAVFAAAWIPGIVSVVLHKSIGQNPVASLIIQNAPAFQSILTTIVILTKVDVRKYIKDLFTCAYLSKDHSCYNAHVAELERVESQNFSARQARTLFTLSPRKDAESIKGSPSVASPRSKAWPAVLTLKGISPPFGSNDSADTDFDHDVEVELKGDANDTSIPTSIDNRDDAKSNKAGLFDSIPGVVGANEKTNTGGLFSSLEIETPANAETQPKSVEKPKTGGLFDSITDSKPKPGGLFGPLATETKPDEKSDDDKPKPGGLFGPLATDPNATDRPTEEKIITTSARSLAPRSDRSLGPTSDHSQPGPRSPNWPYAG